MQRKLIITLSNGEEDQHPPDSGIHRNEVISGWFSIKDVTGTVLGWYNPDYVIAITVEDRE